MSKKIEPTYLPALKGRIGKWAFYTTLMTLKEVEERIYLSNEIYENQNLSDMVQRSIKSGRAEQIADYLKNEEERFLPAMVVAVFEGEPNWLEFSIRKENEDLKLDPSALDRAKVDSFGFLSLNGKEKLFPLDGQHRLSGIRKALSSLNENNAYLGEEEVTVMLVGHEPNHSGRTRSRRLFTTLNKRAVSVKKHETIALDEDDVMAIATRHLVENFSPLSSDEIISFRTNANIPANDSKVFTTIVTLYDILFDLFKAISKRKPEILKFNRPNEEWLTVYLECAECFFKSIIKTFPEVNMCLTGNDTSDIIAKNRRHDGGHILFRPVGQRLIAQLVCEVAKSSISIEFEDEKSSPTDTKLQVLKIIQQSVEKFSDLPTDLSNAPYARLIFEPESKKIINRRSSIVRDIVLIKYGFLRQATEKGLNKRIKNSIGEKYSIDNFIW